MIHRCQIGGFAVFALLMLAMLPQTASAGQMTTFFGYPVYDAGAPSSAWTGNFTRPALAAEQGALGLARRGYAVVTDVARRFPDVPVELALAVARQESGGRCNIRARDGGLGIMQVMPQTARKMGFDPRRLRECEYGAIAGLTYLEQVTRHHGTGCAGATAYNQGDYRPSRCTRYGRAVMAGMARMRGRRFAVAIVPRRHWRHHRGRRRSGAA